MSLVVLVVLVILMVLTMAVRSRVGRAGRGGCMLSDAAAVEVPGSRLNNRSVWVWQEARSARWRFPDQTAIVGPGSVVR